MTAGKPHGQMEGVIRIMVARFVAPCGHRFASEAAAKRHERKRTCFLLPALRTCKTCVHSRRVRDDNGAPEPYTHTWTTNECGNPDPNLNWEDIPQAHPKTDDLKRDCPGWEWKETK